MLATDTNVNRVLPDTARFFKGHWPHILLAFPGAIAVTAFHEAAHSISVYLQGGTVTSFVCIPSGGKWGEITYEFPPEQANDSTAIALAPYAASLGLCAIAAALASRSRPWSYPVASTVFVWLFIVPVADIANACIPYVLWNADNDLQQAFGTVTWSACNVAAAVGVLVVWAGYLLQRRLYRERRIGLPAYSTLAFAGFLVILVVTSF